MLSDSVDRYVSLHRAAGHVFSQTARILAAFASFSEERGDTHVRVQTCLDWVHRFSSARQRRRFLLAVRRFALAMAAEDLRHEVPSPNLLPLAPYTRPQPYIFSPSQIAALIAAAEDCATVRCPVPGQFPTLFGLVAVTGLRISEAIALDAGDITEDGLLVRLAKNRGRRLLPLHATTEAALSRYLQNRSRVTVDTDAVFLGDNGERLKYDTAWRVFTRMLHATGLKGAAAKGRNPRIHDLRHSFSVRSLEACATGRTRTARHMAALSNYLGHSTIDHTYWYIEGTPLLMRRIAERTEAFRREGAS